MEKYTFADGSVLPRVGLGTWEAPKGEVGKALKEAIEIGYRHLDFAAVYGNEKEIGVALSEIFKEGKVKREDLWITSKLWNDSHRPERVLPACKKTLADLQLDYLDLYLIHWPIAFVPADAEGEPKDRNPDANIDTVPIRETWAAMEDLVAKGLTKHIGVSNFNVSLLNDLLSYAKIKPAVDQIELHPYNQQTRLVRWCAKKGIHCTGYSPLVRVGTVEAPVNVLTDPIITKIAKKHNRSNAQVALRWQLQREPNISIIPKSTRKERIAENFKLFDFELDEEDMKEMATLDRCLRMCEPSKFFGIPVFD